MMNKYKYNGQYEVIIDKVGRVKPGDEIETEIEINHPLFEKITKVKKEKKGGDE